MKHFPIKLTKFRLFLLMVAVLVLSTLGFSVKEYFESKIDTSQRDYKGDRVNQASRRGGRYNPFGNRNIKSKY